MVDFNALRQRKGSSFEALQKKAESTGASGFKKDERIWAPKMNKDNKSSNIIRLLPVPYVDEVAAAEGKIDASNCVTLAKVLSYSFQGPNGWYVEKALATFGDIDPVRVHDQPLWKIQKEQKDEALKKILVARLPKTDYYVGILVIKDGTNSENNGKVMLYKFGETVKKIIDKCDKPEFDTDPRFDPFDPWSGRNLILNLTYSSKKIGDKDVMVPDFTGVKWSDECVIGSDEEIERIWKEQHSIAAFYDRSTFKTFEELDTKFNKVMGIGSSNAPSAPAASSPTPADFEQRTAEAPAMRTAPAPTQKSDDSDALAEFEALLAGN